MALEEARKDIEGQRVLVGQSIAELESLVSKDKSLLSEYRGRIQNVLKKPADEKKPALAGLITSLLLQEGGIKIALSSVNQKALYSSVLVFAPPMALHTTGRPGLPALIEGTIPLPGLTQLRSKSCLTQLYRDRHLSARQIARLTKVSRSTALSALGRFGILQNGKERTHPGQLSFGYDYRDYHLVENQAEQEVIRLMRQGRAGGLTLRQIAGQLNGRLVSSKDGAPWQANTVRLILARA